MTLTQDRNAEPITRSVSLDVFVEDGLRQPVLNAVRRYRTCCRQVYSVLLLAQQAGCEIVEVDGSLRANPVGDRAGAVLAALRGQPTKESGERGEGVTYTVKGGKGLAYDLRDYVLRELWPTALSFVWDSLRRDVVTVWTSADPEHPKAKRGWLALQGARGVAWFNHRGMGFPVATARPKLEKHSLRLKWDREQGEVEFRLANMDGGRYHVWRNLRDGGEGWKLGTIYLSERDGRLFACLSHSRPARKTEVDPERVCTVSFGPEPEKFLTIAGPDGVTTHDTISAVEAIAWLKKQLAVRTELERRKAACGNPRRPWGHRKGWLAAQDVLNRATLQRERGVADRNHAWTRRIAERATAWRCGTVIVGPRLEEGLFGQPWKWSQFGEFLEYKCDEERGIKLEIMEAQGNG